MMITKPSTKMLGTHQYISNKCQRNNKLHIVPNKNIFLLYSVFYINTVIW